MTTKCYKSILPLLSISVLYEELRNTAHKPTKPLKMKKEILHSSAAQSFSFLDES